MREEVERAAGCREAAFARADHGMGRIGGERILDEHREDAEVVRLIDAPRGPARYEDRVAGLEVVRLTAHRYAPGSVEDVEHFVARLVALLPVVRLGSKETLLELGTTHERLDGAVVLGLHPVLHGRTNLAFPRARTRSRVAYSTNLGAVAASKSEYVPIRRRALNV